MCIARFCGLDLGLCKCSLSKTVSVHFSLFPTVDVTSCLQSLPHLSAGLSPGTDFREPPFLLGCFLSVMFVREWNQSSKAAP